MPAIDVDRPLVVVIDASALAESASDLNSLLPRRQDVPKTLDAYAVIYREERGGQG